MRDHILIGRMWQIECWGSLMPKGKFIEYPILVPPGRLWWQCGDEGPKRLEESHHAIGAKEIVGGKAPERTVYADHVKDDGSKTTQGKPAKFAMLIQSISGGWNQGRSPIIAGINRRGEIVLHDGFHRSAASLALGLDRIPVAIHFRDHEWWEVKHAVKKLNGGPKLYQFIDHPDFYYWPCWRSDTLLRAEAIEKYLTSFDKHCISRVADVGFHTGTISHYLSRAGYNVRGYEVKEQALKTAALLGKMTDIGSKATFHNIDSVSSVSAVYTVCLSVINHFYVRGDSAKTRTFLAKIRPDQILILDCPAPGDPVGGNTEFTQPQFVFTWLKTQGIQGRGVVIKPRNKNFQRSLLAYHVT